MGANSGRVTARVVVFGGAVAGGVLALGLLAGAVWPRSSALPDPPSSPRPSSPSPPSPATSPPRAPDRGRAEAEEEPGWLPPELQEAAAEYRKRCSSVLPSRTASGMTSGGLRFRQEVPMAAASAAVLTVGKTLRTGAEAVVLVASHSSGGDPVCEGGDLYEATAWSEDNRAVVSVLDLGGGLHRLAFSPKMPGAFRLCIHLFRSARLVDVGGWPSPEALNRPYDRRSRAGPADGFMNAVKKKVPLQEWCPDPRAETQPSCHTVQVVGDPVLPPRECPQDYRSSLKGSWVRASDETCKPGLCRGDLKFLATGGWVYVPDECYLRLYNPPAAWECLAGKRLLWFGDSTAKQPATDMVEMLLRVPVLRRSFRWQRDHCLTGAAFRHATRDRRGAKATSRRLADMGCAIQFDHRQWLVTRTNPRNTSQQLRMRHIWAGGPSPPAGPGSSPKGLDLLMAEAWGGKKGRNTLQVFEQGLREAPHAVFLHAFVWDDDAARHWERFEEKVQRTLNKTLRDTPPSTIVHWAGGHPQCLDDRDHPPSQCGSAAGNKVLEVQAFHNTHLLDHRVRPLYHAEPRVTFQDRFSQSQPHVIGPNYCHFGIHFGAHPQYCYMWEPADPTKCFRNWMVDKIQFMVWLNAFCPADIPITPGAGGGTIEDGVSPADEPPNGSPTDNAF
eukprot:Hpha_TRINITY_DN30376_c0_g1::TRINITY_DN30376_c0_g1_i1::g.146937::m.146937